MTPDENETSSLGIILYLKRKLMASFEDFTETLSCLGMLYNVKYSRGIFTGEM